MRLALPLLALTLASSASAQQTPAPALDRAPQPQMNANLVCRDRIHEAREERGLPDLQRDTAKPGEPLLIAAVDQRIGSCSVLVMRTDTSDIRPLPTEEETARVQRLPGQ